MSHDRKWTLPRLIAEAQIAAETSASFEMPGQMAVDLLVELAEFRIDGARKVGQDQALIAFQGAIQEAELDMPIMRVVFRNARRKLQ